MPYRFTLLADRPILLNTMKPHVSAADIRMMSDDTHPWLDDLDHPVYYVIDLGDTKLGLDAIMEGVNVGIQGRSPSLLHANIVEMLVVSTDPMIAMAVRSASTSPLFRKLHVKLFTTLDEAVKYVDTQF